MVVILKRGLFQIPLVIVPSWNERQESITLNQFSNCCNARVGYKKYCKKCEKKLLGNEIKKGYEGTILSDEQLEEIKNINENMTIELLGFKKFKEEQLTDMLIFAKKSYFVLADNTKNKRGISMKSYYALKDGMENQKVMAIGKLTMRNKERLVVIFNRGFRLVLIDLAFPESYNYEEVERLEKYAEKVDYDNLMKNAVDFIKDNINGFSISKVKNKTKEVFEEMIEEIVKGVKREEKKVKEENPFLVIKKRKI